MASDRIDTSHARQAAASELLDRLPPQNTEAERAVLGSILINPMMCDEVALILRADDFYADQNRILFKHMLLMHDEGRRIDMTLLVEGLRAAGEFETIGGGAYLGEIAHAVPVAAHAVDYAEIVRDKAQLRRLIHTMTQVLRDAYDPTVEPRSLLNTAEERIFALNDARRVDDVISMHDLMVAAFEKIDHRLQHGGATGKPTGFLDLDRLTGGLHDSELWILAARPSMGKTALATNIAEYVAVEGKNPTLFVSLEMSRLELAQRLLCSRGRINGSKFRSGYLSGEDREQLVKASSELSTAPLFIDDTPTRTVTEVASVARRLKRRCGGLGLIVIDYLQLIEPDNPRDPRQEQVAKIARQLKGLARRLDVPVLCLAQLNRQADATSGSRPKLSHLRESGAIEQDADLVMFVHREDYGMTREDAQNQQVAGQAEVIVAKQRNGPTDDVKLHWFHEFTRFESATKHQHDEFTPFSGESDVF
jgi:replicative DNA helicase